MITTYCEKSTKICTYERIIVILHPILIENHIYFFA